MLLFSLLFRFWCKYAHNWDFVFPNTQNAVICTIFVMKECGTYLLVLYNHKPVFFWYLYFESVFSLMEIIQRISLFFLRFRSWQNSGLVVGKKSIIFLGLVTYIHLLINLYIFISNMNFRKWCTVKRNT